MKPVKLSKVVSFGGIDVDDLVKEIKQLEAELEIYRSIEKHRITIEPETHSRGRWFGKLNTGKDYQSSSTLAGLILKIVGDK